MSDANDGGPAFPWGEHGTHLGGMTLRDKFADTVLPAIYVEYWQAIRAGDQHQPGWREGIARDAYAMADAMLAERSAR